MRTIKRVLLLMLHFGTFLEFGHVLEEKTSQIVKLLVPPPMSVDPGAQEIVIDVN